METLVPEMMDIDEKISLFHSVTGPSIEEQ
jgi:hypothetical protein